eukprot:EG_transcript_38887
MNLKTSNNHQIVQIVILGIATDGASNMEAMRNVILEKVKGLWGAFSRCIKVDPCLSSGMQSWICQAHAVHLLVGDYLKDKGRDKVVSSVVAGVLFIASQISPFVLLEC